MQLIAIDEAGYGPRLGPLVIAATQWEPRQSSPCLQGLLRSAPNMALQTKLDAAWGGYREPVDCDGVAIRVDDSKAVFRSRSADRTGRSLHTLRLTVSALQQLTGIASDQSHWQGWMSHVLVSDGPSSGSHLAIPWLDAWRGSQAKALEPIAVVSGAVERWKTLPWLPVASRARVVSAEAFNRFCHPAMSAKGSGARGAKGLRRNKSDLLSLESLRLLVNLLESTIRDDAGPILVFFDRHGGRRYYTKVIQEALAPTSLEVLEETRQLSVYRCRWRGHVCWLHFTVKGDRFVPVAASSLHAKYLRESAMASFNHHFRSLWEELGAEQRETPAFRETAGYPVDAERFLRDMRGVLKGVLLPLDAIVRRS
ncbi:MAG: hypothetical protein AAGD07_07755 [Planctomycetota bacterium]